MAAHPFNSFYISNQSSMVADRLLHALYCGYRYSCGAVECHDGRPDTAGLRGSYFGMRSRIGGFVTLIFVVRSCRAVAINDRQHSAGFCNYLSGCMGGRLFSLLCLSRMSEPHPVFPQNTPKVSIAQISRRLFSTNIGRLSFLSFLTAVQDN